ncbi:hypothetical protein R1flu_001385 [Riccia fluitans]|uniref:Uncharacterized protein n=1 Tax=Riccia fluitans TaxID=41844 RepID=A0ABD1Y340_9MARC
MESIEHGKDIRRKMRSQEREYLIVTEEQKFGVSPSGGVGYDFGRQLESERLGCRQVHLLELLLNVVLEVSENSLGLFIVRIFHCQTEISVAAAGRESPKCPYANADGVETFKVLEPPADASVGDRVYLKGNTPSASPAKQLSSKIWEKIVPLLKVEGGAATYDKIPLVTSSGVVQVTSLPDGAGIH